MKAADLWNDVREQSQYLATDEGTPGGRPEVEGAYLGWRDSQLQVLIQVLYLRPRHYERAVEDHALEQSWAPGGGLVCNGLHWRRMTQTDLMTHLRATIPPILWPTRNRGRRGCCSWGSRR